MSSFIKYVVGIVGVVATVGLTLASCTVSIEGGEVGIKTAKLGPNPGVQLAELPPGLHFEGFGEKIVAYPTRQRVYSYTREANADGKENEEISFADRTGLPMTADVNLTIKVREDRAADLYAEYKVPFDTLIDNPIRNDVRSFLSQETEKVPVSCSLSETNTECAGSLMGKGRQEVLQRAFAPLRAKWAAKGVEISDMQWVGTIRYPETITNAIKARTETEQRTLAAQQRKAEAEANAAAQIETARGVAESIRLRGEALRANPEIIQQIYAERSSGICPPTVKTCIIGNGAWGIVPDGNKNDY